MVFIVNKDREMRHARRRHGWKYEKPMHASIGNFIPCWTQTKVTFTNNQNIVIITTKMRVQVSNPVQSGQLKWCTCPILCPMKNSPRGLGILLSIMFTEKSYENHLTSHIPVWPANWRWPCSKPSSHWKEIGHLVLQQINLALNDVLLLCQDHVSWWDKVALMSSTPHGMRFISNNSIKFYSSIALIKFIIK